MLSIRPVLAAPSRSCSRSAVRGAVASQHYQRDSSVPTVTADTPATASDTA